MKRDKKSLVAYAAGIIDGEGSISPIAGPKRNPRHWGVSLSVQMKEYEAINLLTGLFGGSPRICERKEHTTMWVWSIRSATRVKKILQTLLPFLRVKQEQAEIGIRFCSRIITGRKKLYAKLSRYNHPRISDHETQLRIKIAKQLSSLNHKPFVYRARAETKREETQK